VIWEFFFLAMTRIRTWASLVIFWCADHHSIATPWTHQVRKLVKKQTRQLGELGVGYNSCRPDSQSWSLSTSLKIYVSLGQVKNYLGRSQKSEVWSMLGPGRITTGWQLHVVNMVLWKSVKSQFVKFPIHWISGSSNLRFYRISSPMLEALRSGSGLG